MTVSRNNSKTKASDRHLGVRTTISLAKIVWTMASAQMRDRGFNGNFSAYVAELIRRDHEDHKQGI